MSESDESGAEESPLDSASDWSEAGKAAAAEAAEAVAEDDDVSLAEDSDSSPGSAHASKKGGSSRKRRKPSPLKVFTMLLTRKNSASLATAQVFLLVLIVVS